MSRKYKFRDNFKLYFVSFAVINWIDVFIRNEYKEILLDSLQYCQKNRELELYAQRPITSHVHLITERRGNPMRNIIRNLKSYISTQLRHAIGEHPQESRKESAMVPRHRSSKRRFFFILPIIFISTTLSAQNSTLSKYQGTFDKHLKEWVSSFSNFRLTDFKEFKTQPFDNNYKQDCKRLNSFYSVYKPILTFSKDSTCFIDIYSYQLNLVKEGDKYMANPDVDQVILLYNKKEKYWDRIFFGTPSLYIEEAIWLNNSDFLLLAVGLDKNDKKRPSILVVDFSKKEIAIFNNTNSLCYQNDIGYKSPKLKRLNISGL